MYKNSLSAKAKWVRRRSAKGRHLGRYLNRPAFKHLYVAISYQQPNYGRETTCPLSSVHRPSHILPCVLRAGPPPWRYWLARAVRAQRPSLRLVWDAATPEEPVAMLLADSALATTQLYRRRHAHSPPLTIRTCDTKLGHPMFSTYPLKFYKSNQKSCNLF